MSVSSQKYGFGIRDPEKTYSGSRIQGSKRHRIPGINPCFFFRLVIGLNASHVGCGNRLRERHLLCVCCKEHSSSVNLKAIFFLYAICGSGWIGISLADPDRHPGSCRFGSFFISTECKAQLSIFPVMWSRNYLLVNANMETGTVQNGREF